MNKLWIAVLAAALAVPVAAAALDKVASLSGELVDMVCFMKHDGKGEKHAKCAQMCVKGGAPLGMLTAEGQVYLLVNEHGNEKPFAEAKLLAGGNAKVTGLIVKRGGVQAIIVAKVEKP